MRQVIYAVSKFMFGFPTSQSRPVYQKCKNLPGIWNLPVIYRTTPEMAMQFCDNLRPSITKDLLVHDIKEVQHLK